MPKKQKNFVLAPSDFGFLFNECKSCYYDKYINKIIRPKYSMPAIFTTIDGLMTSYYDNKPSNVISDDMPPGIITLGGLFVKSKPIFCKEYNCNIIISGKIDSLIKFDDGTFGIIDFKTTFPKKTSADFYFSQLMSYAVALEHNNPEYTKTCKVSKMGLCCFKPQSFTHEKGLLGETEWVEIKKDKDKFKNLLIEAASILSSIEQPDSGEFCEFCKFKSF